MTQKDVLVVDNEKDHLDVMRQILRTLGYNVFVAENSQTAITMVQSRNIPVVITDLIMPDMEGTELCETIKRLDPDTVVFAYSGHARLYDPERLERAGFEGYISKPVIIDQVARMVGEAFALTENGE